jgi:hypothetical protein
MISDKECRRQLNKFDDINVALKASQSIELIESPERKK